MQPGAAFTVYLIIFGRTRPLMNPVGLNVRCSRYDLAYTQQQTALSCSSYRQKKMEQLANTVNIRINLTQLSCKIKVELLEYITPTQRHILH